LSAGEALAKEAGEGVHRIQGCEQDPIPLRSVMVGQPGRRDRLPDASLAAREDVTHLGSLREQFWNSRDGRPPHKEEPHWRSCESNISSARSVSRIAMRSGIRTMKNEVRR